MYRSIGLAQKGQAGRGGARAAQAGARPGTAMAMAMAMAMARRKQGGPVRDVVATHSPMLVVFPGRLRAFGNGHCRGGITAAEAAHCRLLPLIVRLDVNI